MEELQVLWKLQEVELAINGAKEKEERWPIERKRLEETLRQREEELQRARKEIEDLEKRRRKLEGEVEEVRQRVKKSRLRLLEVKTNEEYQAVLHEIEWGENTIGTLEEEILVILEDLDRKRAELQTLEAKVREEQERIRGELRRLEGEQKELREMVQQWQRAREELLKGVPPNLLRLYEGLKRKRGFAVALVKGEVCQGCFMHIPPQLYNDILRNDKIHTCPNCQRILYYDRESEA